MAESQRGQPPTTARDGRPRHPHAPARLTHNRHRLAPPESPRAPVRRTIPHRDTHPRYSAGSKCGALPGLGPATAAPRTLYRRSQPIPRRCQQTVPAACSSQPPASAHGALLRPPTRGPSPRRQRLQPSRRPWSASHAAGAEGIPHTREGQTRCRTASRCCGGAHSRARRPTPRRFGTSCAPQARSTRRSPPAYARTHHHSTPRTSARKAETPEASRRATFQTDACTKRGRRDRMSYWCCHMQT
mmetsp:Transcript_32318/g.37296  ORF Transcript_32318/g.37296 Transcript_32318/m.37296 type:complete len:244 (-) Transcript_32318:46-777(-)